MELNKRLYRELVSIALNNRAGWVPIGPLEAARRRKLRTYDRSNRLVELEQGGLITLTVSKTGETATIRLNEAGKEAIRAMPDDVGANLFPLPQDIARAKQRVSQAENNKK